MSELATAYIKLIPSFESTRTMGELSKSIEAQLKNLDLEVKGQEISKELSQGISKGTDFSNIPKAIEGITPEVSEAAQGAAAEIPKAFKELPFEPSTTLDGLRDRLHNSAMEIESQMGDDTKAIVAAVDKAWGEEFHDAHVHFVKNSLDLGQDVGAEFLGGATASVEANSGAFKSAISRLGESLSNLLGKSATVQAFRDGREEVGTLGAVFATSFAAASTAVEGFVKSAGKYWSGFLKSFGKFSVGVASAAAGGVSLISGSILRAGLKLRKSLMGEWSKLLEDGKDWAGLMTRAMGGQSVAPIFDAMVETFGRYTTAMNNLKKEAPSVIADFFSGIQKEAPAFWDAFFGAIQAAFRGIGDSADSIAGIFSSLAQQAAKGFMNALTVAFTNVSKIFDALGDSVMIENVIALIVERVPAVAEAFMTLFSSAVTAMQKSIPVIVENLPTLIQSLVDALVSNLPAILQGSLELFMGIAMGLVEAIPQIVDMLPDLVYQLTDALVAFAPELVMAGVQLFLGLVDALPQVLVALISAIPAVIAGAVNAFREHKGDFVQAGKDLIAGLVQGLSPSVVIEKIKQICRDVKQAILDFFKAGSPSRLMKDIGKNMIMKGWEIGLEQGAPGVVRVMRDTSAAMLSAVSPYQYAYSGASAAFNSQPINIYVDGARLNDDEQIESVSRAFLVELIRKGES